MPDIDIEEERVHQAFDTFLKRKNIAEQCTEQSLISLREVFLTSKNEEMDIHALRDAFENILHISLSEDEFNDLFRKINLKRDGYVTWDEFISYLLVEFQENDAALQWKILELPIRGIPQIIKSRHRTPISRITFCPEVLPDRSVSFYRGFYITCSKDGMINYWSLDLDYVFSVQSSNPHLKIQPTAITDMIVLPDIQIVCTSSTECDLRFYDAVGKKFDLRIMISGLENAVVCMSYYFNKNIKEDSYVVFGDMNGSVKLMFFSPVERGPFKHEPERDVLFLRYETVLKGDLKGLRITEIKNIHSDWVTQVAYYGSLRGFMSSSRCDHCSLLFSDPTGTRSQYKFRVKMGITCFTYCEESQTLATGGPDCTVRIWNPFVTRRASNTFQGHHAAICALVLQSSGKRVYSLSKDKCIKVWDVLAQYCIQTYNGLPNELGEHTTLCIVYNTLNHKMIVASTIMAAITCDPVINKESTDGFTHTKAVSCVLYNHLYKVIVSTGLDSCIIIWDPWLGRRLYLVTHAHSQLLYGQHHNIEITAACFDDSEQLLVTGARDGTLKIWNFNTGTCLRNMAIEYQCEVTGIVWLENRILCTGWNYRVTEFATSDMDVFQKNWSTDHTDYILCTAMRYPQVLATATYNGEVVLWRLETGQPYRKYQVIDATARTRIAYTKRVKEKPISTPKYKGGLKDYRIRGKSTIEGSKHQESALNITRVVAVRAMIFLTARLVAPNVATLLISLDSGLIQAWTHHPAGGFLEAFSVIHKSGDCALSLATDPENNFLLTGHKIGYLKMWYLANYLEADPPKASMPPLRLEFPFLWKDRIKGRAKRAIQDQPLPILLSSVRGHIQAVTSVQIIPSARLIVSGSEDRSIRLWTLGGRYISTLGTFQPWSPILPSIPAFQYFDNYRFPPDVKRIASSTSMKVFRGGDISEILERDDVPIFLKDMMKEKNPVIDGQRLTISLLDKSKFTIFLERPTLDSSLPYIPIYTHLLIRPVESVKPPKLPPRLHGQKELMQVVFLFVLKCFVITYLSCVLYYIFTLCFFPFFMNNVK